MYGGMSPPMIQNSMNRGSVIVRHREYVADIGGTINFTNRNFALNPGLNGTFPWLSQVAAAFEQYRFRGLIWEFRSTSADSVINAQPNVGMGTVIMATQYNSLDPGFTNKIEMENYEYANSCKPACSFIHPVECALHQTPNTPLYIRTGGIPTQSDERLYDMGNFNIATSGLAADGGVIGELWVTFEIELFKPKFTFDEALELGIDHFHSDSDESGTQTISRSRLMGNLTEGFYAGNIGCWLSYPLASVLQINFPEDGTITPHTFFQISALLVVISAANLDVSSAAAAFHVRTGAGDSAGFRLPIQSPVTPNLETTGYSYEEPVGYIGNSGATNITVGPNQTTNVLLMHFIEAIPLAGGATSGPRFVQLECQGLSVANVSGYMDLYVMRVASNPNWANRFLERTDLTIPGV